MVILLPSIDQVSSGLSRLVCSILLTFVPLFAFGTLCRAREGQDHGAVAAFETGFRMN
jgi:hypothetical protein